jgi:hypothetical protein
VSDSEAVVPVPAADLDERSIEGWCRESSEPDLRCVEAFRLDDPAWPWMVVVSAMEFVRADLECEIRNAMTAGLRATPGVADVAREDREVWIISGSPAGPALVNAAAQVIDRFADRARAQGA